MMAAFRADLLIIFKLFAINKLFTMSAFNPEVVRYFVFASLSLFWFIIRLGFYTPGKFWSVAFMFFSFFLGNLGRFSRFRGFYGSVWGDFRVLFF